MILYKAHKQEGTQLNANENPQKPSKEWLLEMNERLLSEELNRYPEDSNATLIEAYAQLYGLNPKGVLTGNGSDALLQLIITTFCRNGKPLVCIDPDFGMYHFYASALQTKTYTLPTSWHGAFDLEALVSLAKEKDAGLVLFSNPNNPTGHQVSADEIIKLAQALNPIVLAVDEAYMDFSDQSVLDKAQALPNLIVTRTLSKAWGLAGIRVGFLIANPTLVETMEQWRIVYSISRLDQLAALITLQNQQYTQNPGSGYVALVQEESKRLEKAFQDLGLQTGPFHANFYSLTLSCPQENAKLEKAFQDAGLSVRTWPDHHRLRITIGIPKQNDQVLEVIKTFLANLEEEKACAKL